MTLVERLRVHVHGLAMSLQQERHEAADEIERLRLEKTELLKKRNTEEMQRMIDYWGKRTEKAEAEVKRLRTENEELLELRDALKKASAQLYPGFNMSRILEVHMRKMEP